MVAYEPITSLTDNLLLPGLGRDVVLLERVGRLEGRSLGDLVGRGLGRVAGLLVLSEAEEALLGWGWRLRHGWRYGCGVMRL